MGPGLYAAAVTPFDERGRIDFGGVGNVLAWLASHGCAGAVLAGTNGEGPSLSAPEKRELVSRAVPVAERLGLEVVLGIATPSLDEAAWLCRQAHDAGCAAVLLMPPGYYRDVGDESIGAWFRAILDASPIDVLVYNYPQKTGVSLKPALVSSLADHPRMIGLKDSSGDPNNVEAYADASRGKLLYVGDETLVCQCLGQRWSGSISGAANVLPRWLSQILLEWHERRESAEAKFELILPALRALRALPQPAANKAILHRLGVLPRPDVRLPLESFDPAKVPDPVWQLLR